MNQKNNRDQGYQKLLENKPGPSRSSQSSYYGVQGRTSTFHTADEISVVVDATKQSKEDPSTYEEQEMRNKQVPRGSFLIKYACQQSVLLCFGMLALFGSLIVEFAVPYFSSKMIALSAESRTDDQAWHDLKLYGLYLGIIVIVSAVSSFFRGLLFQLASERIARNMRKDLYKAILSQEVGYFDENKTGSLISRISSDITVIQDGLSTNVSMAVRAITFITGSLVLLFISSWQLTLGLFGVLIPVSCYTGILGNIMKRIQEEMQDSKAKMTSTSQEAIANIRTVKAFSTEGFEVDKFHEGNKEVYKIGKKGALMYALFLLGIITFMWGCVVGMLLFGGYLVREGQMNAEQITYFILTLIQLLLNFMMLGGVIGAVMKVRGAATKLGQILSREPKINHSEGRQPQSSQGDLELKNITFCYPTKPNVKVLKDVNLQIKQGMVVALVGSSGGGKSSVVSIIERFYDPISGTLEYDGADVRELNPFWYHKQVSLVQQEPVLFSGSIRENIAYGIEATEDALIEAAKMANAYNFIMDESKFPQGFDTIVGERGVLLSGGQKQRVAIARALVRKPKVLVLDEATSALDSESEHLVQQALDNLISQGQQTVIVIAHRLSTVKDADMIVVINKGEIVETGTHKELLERGGHYEQLVRRQLEKY